MRSKSTRDTMATVNENHQQHHLIILPLLILLTLSATATSQPTDNFTDFTFTSFPSASAWKLIFQGDAAISTASKTISLTKTYKNGTAEKNSVGRVFYSSPIHLWHKSRDLNQISTFETTFTFVVNSPTREIIGDGLTFFFAPVDSTIPPDSDGGFLGLFSNNSLPSTVDVIDSPYHILAVEFDTYIDSRWDPNYPHIGIDTNTIRSRAQIPWTRKNGTNVTVNIKYNTNNKNLFVVASYSDDDFYELSSSVDLDVVLPEYVWVGFSASTGDSAVETHSLRSWTFTSWLHDVSATTSVIKQLPLHHELANYTAV